MDNNNYCFHNIKCFTNNPKVSTSRTLPPKTFKIHMSRPRGTVYYQIKLAKILQHDYQLIRQDPKSMFHL